MKIVALEEHFVTEAMLAAWDRLPEPDRTDALAQTAEPDIHRRLLDLGDERLRAMDEAGVDVQVLSLNTPGAQNLPPAGAVAAAQQANDALAAAVRARPDRFAGFATLPTAAPEQAARELERVIRELGLHGAMLNGRTGARNLDHPDLRPVFAAAADLGAPLYLHPQLPVPAVREQLYAGFGEKVDKVFGQAAIGWHYETGVQLIRLILAGTFDRHPELQIISGHWGEAVLFYLERIAMLDPVAGLDHPIADYFRRNVSLTPSGIWSQRYFRWALEVMGPARILCATDYPYVRGDMRAFLNEAALGDREREMIAHGNWDRLMAGIRR